MRQKKTKKVKFKEPEISEEKAKKLLGGAIRGDVRKMNVVVPEMPSIHKLLREVAYTQGSAPMTEYIHGAVDMNPRNLLAYYQYYPSFQGEREQDLHSTLMSLTKHGGASKHHHRVQKTIYESLKHHPKLASLYLNS